MNSQNFSITNNVQLRVRSLVLVDAKKVDYGRNFGPRINGTKNWVNFGFASSLLNIVIRQEHLVRSPALHNSAQQGHWQFYSSIS